MRLRRAALSDGVASGAIAAALSGAPSTIHALSTRRPVLEPSLAAGSLVLPGETRTGPLLGAALVVHIALSLGWGVALSLTLSRSKTALWGGVAGLGIAALDLGVAGRHVPRIAALPLAPQVADHLAFGLVTGAVLARRRARQEL